MKGYLACLSIVRFSYFPTFQTEFFVEWRSFLATKQRHQTEQTYDLKSQAATGVQQ